MPRDKNIKFISPNINASFVLKIEDSGKHPHWLTEIPLKELNTVRETKEANNKEENNAAYLTNGPRIKSSPRSSSIQGRIVPTTLIKKGPKML